MKKQFNITGTCYSDVHYMMDNSAKLAQIMELVEQGNYFSINRPRQYGKTTMLSFIADHLNQTENYSPISLNFQGIDTKFHESDTAFGQMFLNELTLSLKFQNPQLAALLKGIEPVSSLNEVSAIISDLVYSSKKKIVLLIDEVDASSEYAAFINFLGMLRAKFLTRRQVPTFHSIVLVGVHDIKNLKYKLRNPEEAQYNSPWNIAIDFKVNMSFNSNEIEPMLEQYCKAESITMDIPKIAQRLYYYTSGYPFLVSKLCKDIVDEILITKPQNQRNQWTIADVEASVRLLLKENNTNFDSLIGNLENHKDLYDLVYQIVIEGTKLNFNQYNPTIYKGILYGIFKRNGRIRIHNRIYEQLIYDYMTSITSMKLNPDHNYSEHFKTENNGLDIKAVLLKFQQFMKEQYSEHDRDFYERQGRLIFLAFLDPILNGHGYAFREVQTSQEKRLDAIITYFEHRYIIELKKWYGGKYHNKGLNQLADYLNIHSVDKGYLIIFDDRKSKSWESQMIQHQDKEIFAIWV